MIVKFFQPLLDVLRLRRKTFEWKIPNGNSACAFDSSLTNYLQSSIKPIHTCDIGYTIERGKVKLVVKTARFRPRSVLAPVFRGNIRPTDNGAILAGRFTSDVWLLKGMSYAYIAFAIVVALVNSVRVCIQTFESPVAYSVLALSPLLPLLMGLLTLAMSVPGAKLHLAQVERLRKVVDDAIHYHHISNGLTDHAQPVL